jgi:hypothetical protein
LKPKDYDFVRLPKKSGEIPIPPQLHPQEEKGVYQLLDHTSNLAWAKNVHLRTDCNGTVDKVTSLNRGKGRDEGQL